MIHNHEVRSSILRPATNLKGSFRGTYEEIRKCFFRIIFDLGNTEGTQTSLFFSFLAKGVAVKLLQLLVKNLLFIHIIVMNQSNNGYQYR